MPPPFLWERCCDPSCDPLCVRVSWSHGCNVLQEVMLVPGLSCRCCAGAGPGRAATPCPDPCPGPTLPPTPAATPAATPGPPSLPGAALAAHGVHLPPDLCVPACCTGTLCALPASCWPLRLLHVQGPSNAVRRSEGVTSQTSLRLSSLRSFTGTQLKGGHVGASWSLLCCGAEACTGEQAWQAAVSRHLLC